MAGTVAGTEVSAKNLIGFAGPMEMDRTPCCLDPRRRPACGTRFSELRAWVCRVTGKGVRVVSLSGTEQGRAPFFAQPVGYDGRAFHIAADHGCDTEKLLHDACHWLVAPKERRSKPNYGLGPGKGDRWSRAVDDVTGDNEEVTVMLLERFLAPHFGLACSKIAEPDYNVADRRNVDFAECEVRASALLDALLPTLDRAGAAQRLTA